VETLREQEVFFFTASVSCGRRSFEDVFCGHKALITAPESQFQL
jgi:hypothetical protein